MRIQHNIAALNAHRYLSSNNDAVAKNLEKLSSGYRINRAGDDAAGLSISEKMRAQITGLETAKKNAQDGVSLVQTAEGNLTEVHSMLNRMTELATQAANGTYQDLNRDEIQKEVDSLTSEIDRISQSANFNGIKLLDGSLSGTAAAKEPVVSAGQLKGAVLDKTAASGLNGVTDVSTATPTKYTTGSLAAGAAGDQKLTVTYQTEDGTLASKEIAYKSTDAKDSNASAIIDAINNDSDLKDLFKATDTGTGGEHNVNIEAKTAGSKGAQIVSLTTTDTAQQAALATGTKTAGTDAHPSLAIGSTGGGGTDVHVGDYLTVNGTTYQFGAAGVSTPEGVKHVEIGATDADSIKNLTDALDKDGVILQKVGTTDTYTFAAKESTVPGKGLVLQIGESKDEYQQVEVKIAKMDSKSLGLAGLDLGNQESALSAIDVVSKAIDSVSATRGGLGAIQNRLEHTINNLSVTDENMTAAESRIRDVDMAKEMMDFTKNNILTQAAQSMLAQANTLPQGVLQLLR